MKCQVLKHGHTRLIPIHLTLINPKPFPTSPRGTFKQSISFKVRLKILPGCCWELNKLLVAAVALTFECPTTNILNEGLDKALC